MAECVDILVKKNKFIEVASGKELKTHRDVMQWYDVQVSKSNEATNLGILNSEGRLFWDSGGQDLEHKDTKAEWFYHLGVAITLSEED